MTSVTMSELKQNPYNVVRRVLASDEPFHLVSRGYDTGAVIERSSRVPHQPKAYLTGAELQALFQSAPLSGEQSLAWLRDIRDATDDDLVRDPWETT